MIIKSRNITRYDVPSAESDSGQITEPAFETSRDCFLRSNSDFDYHVPLQSLRLNTQGVGMQTT